MLESRGTRVKGRDESMCKVQGCESASTRLRRGMCNLHYRRWMKEVQPERISAHAIKWLQAQIVDRDRSTCWEWPFAKDGQGYGHSNFQGRMIKTAIVALILDGRPRPEAPNHYSLHSCDNPGCVNPAHLSWGTHQQNVIESFLRPKSDSKRGTKLSPQDVVAIRKDSRDNRTVARSFGVTASNIQKVRTGKNWAHVIQPEEIEEDRWMGSDSDFSDHALGIDY